MTEQTENIQDVPAAALGLLAEYKQQRARCKLLSDRCKANVASAESAEEKIQALSVSVELLWNELNMTGLSLAEDLTQCLVDVEDIVSGLDDVDGPEGQDDDDGIGIAPEDAQFLIEVLMSFQGMLNAALPATPAKARAQLQAEADKVQEAILLVQDLTLVDDDGSEQDEAGE
jgi:hypothetical protein